LIGFAPIDEQVRISHEVYVIFKYCVIGKKSTGMVEAAVQGNVDRVD